MPIGFSKNERPLMAGPSPSAPYACYQLADEYSNYTPRNALSISAFWAFQHGATPTQGLWDGAERQVLR
jgi:hypothetical protein